MGRYTNPLDGRSYKRLDPPPTKDTDADTADDLTAPEQKNAAEWKGFLGVLRQVRARAPINGALLAVDVAKLLGDDDVQAMAHAAQLRARLGELRQELGIRFPVYVVLTKTDLLRGFAEYFSSLTTEARAQVWGFTLPWVEAGKGKVAPLAAAHDQHQSLGDLARQHRAQDDADQPGVAQDLQAQNDAIGGSAGSGKASGPQSAFPELGAPHIALASPAGIASTTPGSTHQHSGQHHAITSAWHTSIAASKSLLVSAQEAVRMFAYKDGIKLVSAKEDINMQALQKSVHLLAKMDITMTASRITLTAKGQVSINGGGSYTQWSAAGIRSHTTGTHAVHATGFGHVEKMVVPVNVPLTHIIGTPEQSIRFAPIGSDSLLEDAGYEGVPFVLTSADGCVIEKGVVAGGKVARSTLAAEQDHVTLVIGKTDIALIETGRITSIDSEDRLTADIEATDNQLQTLINSPYYQATVGNEPQYAAVNSRQLFSVLDLKAYTNPESVRGGHHE